MAARAGAQANLVVWGPYAKAVRVGARGVKKVRYGGKRISGQTSIRPAVGCVNGGGEPRQVRRLTHVTGRQHWLGMLNHNGIGMRVNRSRIRGGPVGSRVLKINTPP